MKTVGILGGMGSMATVDLFKKIIQSTQVTCDQDHLHIIIDNYADIPDRSHYILHHENNPLDKMIEAALRLQTAGADILAMPCNTAHYFYDSIEKAINIPMIHMMKETEKVIQGNAVLLATEGTYEAKLYKGTITPNPIMKSHISQLIYDYKKDMSINTTLKSFILSQLERVDYIILGCTELPLIFNDDDTGVKLIDPTQILAEAIIHQAGAKLKDLSS